MTQPQYVWSSEDWQAGACLINQIGTPKPASARPPPESPEIQELLDALPPLNMGAMRQSALRVARGKMDYDAFFEKYPTFHQKFLIAMIKESAPPPQTQTPPPMPPVPWLTSERLAYKRQPQALELIENAKEVAPRSLRNQDDPTALD